MKSALKDWSDLVISLLGDVIGFAGEKRYGRAYGFLCELRYRTARL